MAKQTLNTIKNWFKTGLKPTQNQFWDTWDSFWHKDEKIPTNAIENLDSRFDEKADQEAFQHHLVDDNAHQELFHAKANVQHTHPIADIDGLSTKISDIEDKVEVVQENMYSIELDLSNKLTATLATDAETQISTASGITEDHKIVSRLKLFNWWAWIRSSLVGFTNTTESTSTSTGGLTIAGGLGVAKRTTTKGLTVTDYAGGGTKIIATDNNGATSALYPVVTPVITNSTIISQLTTTANWSAADVYTGGAIAGAYQMQYYVNGDYWYYFYDDTTPLRIPRRAAYLAATDAEALAGTLTNKYLTPANWTYLKTIVNNISALWQFTVGIGIGIAGATSSLLKLAANTTTKSQVNLSPSATDVSAPVNGDVWNNAGELKFMDGTIVNRLDKVYNNELFKGSGNRLVEVNQYGDKSAVNTIKSRWIYNTDVIAAITGATYGANKRADINVSGYTVEKGQVYFNASTGTLYEAYDDNKVMIVSESYDTVPTASSLKPVTSDGIKTALDAKVNNSTSVQTGNFNLTGTGRLDTGLGLGVAPNSATWQNVLANTTAKSQLRLSPSSSVDVSVPTNGDIWNNNGEIKLMDSSIVNRFMKIYNNELLKSDGNYVLVANQYGDLSNSIKITEKWVYDTDVISAITGGTYVDNKTTISVSGKTAYKGQLYFDTTSGKLYEAYDDNKILIINSAVSDPLKANLSGGNAFIGNQTVMGKFSIGTTAMTATSPYVNIVSPTSTGLTTPPAFKIQGGAGRAVNGAGFATGGVGSRIDIFAGVGGVANGPDNNLGGTGGEIYILAGDGGNANGGATSNLAGRGGDAVLQAGTSQGNNTGGDAQVKAGNSVSDLGGHVYIVAGYGSGGSTDAATAGCVAMNISNNGTIRGNTLIGLNPGDDDRTNRLQVGGDVRITSGVTVGNNVEASGNIQGAYLIAYRPDISKGVVINVDETQSISDVQVKLPIRDGQLALLTDIPKMFTAIASGDNTTAIFTIPHGLPYTPTMVIVTPNTEDAKGRPEIASAGSAVRQGFFAYIDGSNVKIDYTTIELPYAPQTGTDNLKWTIMVK
jgi:hypothetical protein